MANIFLAIPTHDGRLYADVADVAYGHAVKGDDHQVIGPLVRQSSLLPGVCNWLYAACLNVRKELDITWFALLHSDVSPEKYYLNTLMEEAEKYGADMVSVCVAVKNDEGRTSTAISSGKDFGQFGNLTMRQLKHGDFPPTFDIDMACDALKKLPAPLKVEDPPRHALLANTGCMIVRVDREWSGKVCFRNTDTIDCDENGFYHQRDLSEDWYFSREVARQGGKVFCTTKVPVRHIGPYPFPNFVQWGTLVNDCHDRLLTTNLTVPIRAGAA